MYLKKLIGAFTALIMTVTVFAGSAVSVSAYSEAPNTSLFKLNITCGTDSSGKSWTGYAADMNEFNAFLKKGKTFQHDNETYIVETGILSGLESSTFIANVTVKKAKTITVKITGGGTVTINGNSVSNGNSYIFSDDELFDIGISTNQQDTYIKSVMLGNTPYAVTPNLPYCYIPDAKLNDGKTLSVEFASAHSITIDTSNITNGTVTASLDRALEDEIVTVYPMPLEGYRIASLTYTTGNGSEPVDINNQSGSYTFKMPDAAVTINATFEKIPVYPSTEATHKGDYNDPTKGDSASLWEGTLVGQGTAYCPKVTVTLNNEESKEAIGQTTVDGNSSVTIAVVVDRVKNEIKSVMLEGVADNSSISEEFPIEGQDTVNEGVDQ